MILVDATPLYDLGQVGELNLLDTFEGDVVIPEQVRDEMTVEPAATNLSRYIEEHEVAGLGDAKEFLDDAQALLGDGEMTSDAAVVAGMLAARDRGEEVGLVSDDARLRAIADGLGATVTGTFGVVVRAAKDDKYFPTTQAKRVIRRTDHHGLQMTGTLRERAVGEVDG